MDRRRSDFVETLRQPGFKQLIGSEALIDIGVLARVTAQSWVAYDLTGSNLWVGLASGAGAIPVLVMPLFGGAVADRFDRRLQVAIVRAFSGVLCLIQAVLIGTDTMEPWHLLVLALLAGTAVATAVPAFWAFLSDLVEPRLVPRANAMITFVHNTGEMIGPFIVGALIAGLGAHSPFIFIAFLYFVGAYLILKVPKGMQASAGAPQRVPYLASIRLGVRYAVRTQPIPWIFVMVAATNVFGVAIFPLMPEYATVVFGGGGFAYGAMSGAFGAGMAVGSAYIAIRGISGRTAPLIVGSSFLWDFGMLIFAFSRILPLTLLTIFAMGIVGMFWVNAALCIFQRSAPDHMRGRIMSLYAIIMGIFPLGWAYGGALAEWIGNEPAIIASVLGGTPIVLAAYLLSPALRKA